MKPRLEVADILRDYLDDYILAYGSLNIHQQRIVNDIMHCRTPAMGGRVLECDHCGKQEILYNSCRNRHCPKCQAQNREQWVLNRETELLPVSYFHTVFTVPHALNELFMHNKRIMYDLLFHCVWQTIAAFAQNPTHLGAKTGMMSILHTWGQNLDYHVHLHCLIPGGGLSAKGKWKYAKANGQYLFPVRELSVYFRDLMISGIRTFFYKGDLFFKNDTVNLLNQIDFENVLAPLEKSDWVVFVKPPFSDTLKIINYHARYSHRIAISNYRLVAIENQRVYFKWFDYSTQKKGVMSLHVVEFIRRFLMHILPRRYRKIRYYGIHAQAKKKTELALCMMLLDERILGKTRRYSPAEIFELVFSTDIEQCSCCKKGKMLVRYEFERTRGDPVPDLIRIGVLRK